MAFGIETDTQKADAGFVKGKQREIACHCWFSSKGKVIPLMLKIEDEDGEIRTIRQIEVLSQEEKRYAGVRSLEFNCIIRTCFNAFAHNRDDHSKNFTYLYEELLVQLPCVIPCHDRLNTLHRIQ